MTDEVLINPFSKEEMEGMAEEAIKNLDRRILLSDDMEKIRITNMISTIKRNLIKELNNKNN